MIKRAGAVTGQADTIAPSGPEPALMAPNQRDLLVRRLFTPADVAALATSLTVAVYILGEGANVDAQFGYALLTVPVWVLLFKLYRLCDRDAKRESHATVDDVPWLFHSLLIGLLVLWFFLEVVADHKLVLAESFAFFTACLAVTRNIQRYFPDGGSLCVTLSAIVGPEEHEGRAIPSFPRSLLAGERAIGHGDGSDVRDYLSVRDPARRILAACSSRIAADGILRLGSGTGRTTLEVLRSVGQVMGVDARPGFDPRRSLPSRLTLDTSRARGLFRFEPLVPFEAGLAAEARWTAENL